MTATKIYELISEKLLEADINHTQRMEIRRIIADVLLDSLDDKVDQTLLDSEKLSFSLN